MWRNQAPKVVRCAGDRRRTAETGKPGLLVVTGPSREIGPPARPVDEDGVNVEPRNPDAPERLAELQAGLHVPCRGGDGFAAFCDRLPPLGERVGAGRHGDRRGLRRTVLHELLRQSVVEALLLPACVQIRGRIAPEDDNGGVCNEEGACDSQARPDAPPCHLRPHSVASVGISCRFRHFSARRYER